MHQLLRVGIAVSLTVFVLINLNACDPTGGKLKQFGHFVGNIKTEWLDNNRKMRLLDDFVYVDPYGKKWVAKKDYESDGASIPAPLWSVVGSPFSGQYRKAAVIHDWYCDNRTEPWQEVHKTFYLASRAAGVSETQAKIMYAGIMAGGPRWSETEFETVPDTKLAGDADNTSGTTGDESAPAPATPTTGTNTATNTPATNTPATNTPATNSGATKSGSRVTGTNNQPDRVVAAQPRANKNVNTVPRPHGAMRNNNHPRHRLGKQRGKKHAWLKRYNYNYYRVPRHVRRKRMLRRRKLLRRRNISKREYSDMKSWIRKKNPSLKEIQAYIKKQQSH